MNKLRTGEFYGAHFQKKVFKNSIITDTEYTHDKVDWHYHENPYFTYLLQGGLFEENKKEAYYLQPGDLLFHNWQDAHYNIKPPKFTRGFHVELTENWFLKYGIEKKEFEGSLQLKNPLLKNAINKVFVESKINDTYSALSIDVLLINMFAVFKEEQKQTIEKPDWVTQLQAVILEEAIDYSLTNLSAILGVHPVHLSRSFSRYFGTSLGNYIRVLKLNKAFHLIISSNLSMTEICYACGFFDQSHFITSFKRIYNATPSTFLKKMGRC